MNKSDSIGNLAKALKRTCAECGKEFIDRYKWRKTQFCSLPCANAAHIRKCLENPRTCEIDGCNDKHKCKGLCAKHYKRLRTKGTFDIQIFPDFANRFWSKVDKTETCWLWIGGKDNGGYGTIAYKGRTQKAHRVSWEIALGAIPEDLMVLHTCDVRNCVNPQHLFLGTQTDNMRDMVSKGRWNGADVSGTKNPMSKLNLTDARKIRQEYQTGKYSQHELARMFDVAPMTINAIVRNKRWVEVAE